MKPIDFDTFMHNKDARREAWQRTFSGTAGWEPTDMDGRADLVIHAEIGAVLREIVP